MNIGILRIGNVDSAVIDRVLENLRLTFPNAVFKLVTEILPVSEEAYDRSREQYNADSILQRIHNYAGIKRAFDRILGIVDVDIFSAEMNFVFGKAECPGKAALISLWRLKPEFYGKPSNFELFVERSTKEAVHEIGHTFGLKHCVNPFCVMYFSNSIFETDRKQSLFCNVCYSKIEEPTP